MENNRRENDQTENTPHSHDLNHNKRRNGAPMSFDGMNFEQQRVSYNNSDYSRGGRSDNGIIDRSNERED